MIFKKREYVKKFARQRIIKKENGECVNKDINLSILRSLKRGRLGNVLCTLHLPASVTHLTVMDII